MKTLLIPWLLFGFLMCFSACKSKTYRQPNIIFIMADDLGWQDVGFMGSGWFETPNLDALAKQSLVFNQAYMYPTCSPSRAALLTGRQSFRTGIYNVPVLDRGNKENSIFSRWTLEKKHPTYAEPLRATGYKLIHIGKWHVVGPDPEFEQFYPFEQKLSQPRNGDLAWLSKYQETDIAQYYPTGRGFHENVGGTWWGDPARGHALGYKSESGGYKVPFKNPFIEEKEGDEWLTDRLTDEAIDFIERNKEGPFFVNLHYYAPHRPTVPRNQEWLEKYMDKSPDTLTGQGQTKLKEISAYATMVESIDENVHRIVEYLDENGLSEDTVIIFTSDNGFNALQSTNNRLRGAKGTIYEGGLRVPALAYWPGTIQPDTTDTPISGLDYFPTFLELAGIRNYTETLDGNSILSLLKGQVMKGRTLFWHLAGQYKNLPCSIIRKGDWKLIQFLLDGDLELYDLKNDLKESKNLVHEKPEITEKLLDELALWRKKHQVPLPLSSVLAY